MLYLGSENNQNTGNSHFKLQGEKETLRPSTSLKTKVPFNETTKGVCVYIYIYIYSLVQ